MAGSLAIVLFDGLAFGMLLFVLSVGLSVTLGLMGFINLAHGAFAMLGGYVAVLAMRALGLPFLAALPLAFLAAALVSVVFERTLFRRLYGAGELNQVLFTIGLVFVAAAAAAYALRHRPAADPAPRLAARLGRDRRPALRRLPHVPDRRRARSSRSCSTSASSAPASAPASAPPSTTSGWRAASASTSSASSR